MSSPSGHAVPHRTTSTSNSHSPSHTQQTSPTTPHNYPVRLMKLSSAHAILNSKSKPGQKMLHRLALIIQESATTANESTKGKLPVEAAYVVMKKVTERAGTPIMPVGMSTFNKLESLRTDPAVTVLKSQTWKDFFSGQRPNSPSPGLRASTSQLKSSNQTKTDNPETEGKDGPTLLDVILDTLIGRVETLWDELKVLEKERQFYRKSLCKFPSTSYEQCKDLSLYVDALQEHKVATKAVLFAIQARERAVKRCYDVLLALNRKYARILSSQREGTTTSSAASLQRPTSAPPTPSLYKSSKSEGSPSGFGAQAFWKEELIVALDEVRCCSLDVIKAIQLWRRSLWRPHAFIYRGQNYLFKMQSDMSVLESDVYQRLLAFLPLTLKQLVCILFTPSLVDQLSQQGLVLELPPHIANSQDGGATDAAEETLRSMLYEFTHNIEAAELEAAARVVLQEEALQMAVQTEHQSLLQKGVFIPMLRIAFLSETDEATAEM